MTFNLGIRQVTSAEVSVSFHASLLLIFDSDAFRIQPASFHYFAFYEQMFQFPFRFRPWQRLPLLHLSVSVSETVLSPVGLFAST